MELIAKRDLNEIWFHQMERPFVFDESFPGRRYVAIVFSNDKTVTEVERQVVANSIFTRGCRYGVFSGYSCGAWEHALDTACIESAPDFQPSDEDFTMTTSHQEESIKSVIFFGLNNTNFDSYDFDRFLILFVGRCDGLLDAVKESIQSIWKDGQVV